MSSIYDDLAATYDSMYLSPDDEAENEQVAALVREYAPDTSRVLDVGAGTGLVLDLGIAEPSGYVAVDPSKPMLDRLTVKHPDATTFHGTVTDLFHASPAGAAHEFDTILALFGVASYLSPLDLAYLLGVGVNRRSVRYVLMTYHAGYHPAYFQTRDPAWARANAMIAAIGLPRVDTISGKWDVWAGSIR